MIHITELYDSHSQFINGNFTLVFIQITINTLAIKTLTFSILILQFSFAFLTLSRDWIIDKKSPLWMFVIIVWGERISEIRVNL